MTNIVDFKQAKLDKIAEGISVPLIVDNFHYNLYTNSPWVDTNNYPRGDEYDLFESLSGVWLLMEAKHFYQDILLDHVFSGNARLFGVSIYSVPEKIDICGVVSFIFNNYDMVDGKDTNDFSVGMMYTHNGRSVPKTKSDGLLLSAEQIFSTSVSAKYPEHTNTASTINRVITKIRDRYKTVDPSKVSVELSQHIDDKDEMYVLALSQCVCHDDTWITKTITISFDTKTLNVTWEGKDE